MLTTQQVRASFLDFFIARGHTAVASASLLPQGDPTLLFVNSGMVPFKECFRGLESRSYTRATSCQKSLRVSGKHNDYEQIGTTPRHHTFFEMLGNFSLGDYFKKEAIEYAWDYLTKTLKLPKSHLWVTVHNSDDEAETLWKDVANVEAERIIRLGDDSNLWAMGDFGPRGYSSEIFYYMGSDPSEQSRAEFLKDDGTYLEIWNLVFMQFNRNLDGTVIPLPKPCIDTGSGLERLSAVLQGVKSIFDTDLLRRLIGQTEVLSGIAYNGTTYDKTKLSPRQWETDVAMRVIADHARAMSFLISDGVVPGNEKEAYVLRRLIRRATMRGETLGIKDPFLSKIASEVIVSMETAYPELRTNSGNIEKLIVQEETQFRKTLSGGVKHLSVATEKLIASDVLSGDVAFKLHDTFGFPLDLTEDVLKARAIKVDHSRFEQLMDAQRERSRPISKTGGSSAAQIKELKISGAPSEFIGYEELSAETKVQAIIPTTTEVNSPHFYVVLEETPFYAEMGGQIGDRGLIKIKDLIFEVHDTQKSNSGHIVHVAALRTGNSPPGSLEGEKTIATVNSEIRKAIEQHHSGTHILNGALRSVLGSHVEQRGSLVAIEKLRFDFAHTHPVVADEIAEIQSLVNQIIRENHTVETRVMPLEDAKKLGAVAAFGEKYGATVRVVSMGPHSMEFCGGTHVRRTGDIGLQMLLSEGSISTGVRRVEAVAGPAALSELIRMQSTLSDLAKLVKGSVAELPSRLDVMQQQLTKLSADIKDRDKVIATIIGNQLVGGASPLNGCRYIISTIDQKLTRDTLMLVADQALSGLGKGCVIIGQPTTGNLIVAVSKDQSERVNASTLVKEISKQFGGKGGGKPQSASLVDVPTGKFEEAYELARKHLTDVTK